MFNVKKNTKQGQCMAMRCKGLELENGLCERHAAEWNEAGQPTLTQAEPSKPKGQATALVKAEDDKLKERLDAGREHAQKILRVVAAMPATTKEDLERLGGVVNACGERIKDLESQRKEVTGPLNQSLKRINDWFRPLTDTLKAARKAAGDKILAANAAQAAAQRKALAEVQESKGDASAETYALAHSTPDLPDNVGARTEIDFAIVSASLIPEEYWIKVVNTDKIRAEVKAKGKQCNIPGVTVYEKRSIIKGRS